MQSEFSSQIQELQKKIQNSFIFKQFNDQQNLKYEQVSQNQLKLIIQNFKNTQKIILNSLKLNQKIYHSMIQKQSNVRSNTLNFMDSTAEMQTKLLDTLKRTKQLYEDTVHQNQKARFLLQQFISPIRQQLRSKVDETTFTLQMKMLLDQYDIMGHQITYDNEQQKRIHEQKKKSVNSQTLMFLRDKIMPVISNIQSDLNNNIQKTKLIESRMDQFSSKSRFLEEQLTLQKQIVYEMEKKIVQKINEKLSDSYIQKRLRQTFKSYLVEFREDLLNSIQKVDRYSKNMQMNYNTQYEQLRSSLSTFFENQKATQIYTKNIIERLSKNFQDQSRKFQEKQLQEQKLSRAIRRVQQTFESNSVIKRLSLEMQNLQKRIESQQLKNKNKLSGEQFDKIIKKLMNFDAQANKIKQYEKTIEEKFMVQRGEINGIQDMLSKKANFTDVLHHIESKVDKQQFKELKERLCQQQKGLKLSVGNNSLIIKESQMNHNKSRHIRSRSFFSPSVQKIHDIQNENQSIKRFQLGFNNEIISNQQNVKKQYSKTQHLRQTIMNNSSLFNQKNVPTDTKKL